MNHKRVSSYSKIKQILGVLFLAFWIAHPVFAYHVEANKVVLDNGMTCVVSKMPESPVVSLYALVKTGSATEGKFLGSGITHFVEHMVFKGTKTRAVGQIASQIQAVGGNINASTSKDYTIFTITVPHDHFEFALEILADLLQNATFDPQEVAKEKEVVLNEIRMHHDNPDRKISDLVFDSLYLEHPYKYPVIGYASLFEKITHADVMEYYKTYYVPNNIILSISGNVEKNIIPLIEETFKTFDRSKGIVRMLKEEPRQICPRQREEIYPTKLTRLAFLFPSVQLIDEDLFALDVLAVILGQGTSSRLYQDVYKDKQLVHSIAAYNYTPVDRGFFAVRATLDDENLEQSIEAIKKQIQLIKSKDIDTDEIVKAKRQVMVDHVMGNQTSAQTAYLYAIDEAFTGDYLFSKKYVDATQKVNNHDLLRVANKYLDLNKLTKVVLRAASDDLQDHAHDPAGEAPQSIKKHHLDNGLTLLLKENNTIPIVSLRALINAGTRQEDDATNGISKLTALSWIKATKNKGSKELAEFIDSKGMRLSSFSGKNTIGIELDFLKEDLEEAINLLEDIIKKPTFPDEEIEIIKKKMEASIRNRQDSIFLFSSYHLKKELFKAHPLRLDSNGTIESLTQLSRDDVVAFYKKHAISNNILISAFGDIDSENLSHQLTKRFSSMKQKELVLNTFNERPLESKEEQTFYLPKQQALVMLGFHGVDLRSDDRWKLEVLSEILGSSFNGRLFSKIREEFGNAYSLGGMSLVSVDSGVIFFYCLTGEKDLAKVMDLMKNEIVDLQTNYVSDQELKDIKTYLKGTFKQNIETNSALSLNSALDEIYGLGCDFYKQYDVLIDSVTKQNIIEAAKQYLDLNKSVTIITRPDQSN